MRKTHRKIVSGALLCGCALFTLYGASRIAENIVHINEKLPEVSFCCDL